MSKPASLVCIKMNCCVRAQPPPVRPPLSVHLAQPTARILVSPGSPLLKLTKFMQRIDRDIVYILFNCHEFRSRYRNGFVNIQTQQFEYKCDTLQDLARCIVRQKHAFTNCIYVRIKSLKCDSQYTSIVKFQSGVLPEASSINGRFHATRSVMDCIVRQLSPCQKRLYRTSLPANPDTQHINSFAGCLKQRIVSSALTELSQILSMFQFVVAFGLFYDEPTDGIQVVVRYCLPPIEVQNHAISPLQLASPVTQRKSSKGKCSRSLKQPHSPQSPSLPLILESTSTKEREVPSPPHVRLWS